jgi:hypothetical protein
MNGMTSRIYLLKSEFLINLDALKTIVHACYQFHY